MLKIAFLAITLSVGDGKLTNRKWLMIILSKEWSYIILVHALLLVIGTCTLDCQFFLIHFSPIYMNYFTIYIYLSSVYVCKLIVLICILIQKSFYECKVFSDFRDWKLIMNHTLINLLHCSMFLPICPFFMFFPASWDKHGRNSVYLRFVFKVWQSYQYNQTLVNYIS